jgi:hypothetical protein
MNGVKRVAAGLVLAFLAATPVIAQTSSTTDSAGQPMSYPLQFDSVNTYLVQLIPEAQRGNVRNIMLSSEGDLLRVDAEVRIGAVPGFELFGGLGFAHVTGTGPVVLLQPGLVGWNIRTMVVAGQPIAEGLWAPLVRQATHRPDTAVPFKVGAWVKGVAVEPTGIRLY